MATPKRKHKVRDYDATRRKLLETVGEILRDTGYTGLKTNNIARRAGKDKSLIRYYFQSLSNLQKTYIKENDYWLVFFEDYNIPENPGPEGLKALFVDLMKTNFKFMRDNIEMQKIILWQISERNPLMRSVSDQREIEGGKLLRMTDPYFRNTDVNFRALIAIILGGSYYLVLHAETNKSTVCGIDINLEKDRTAILNCIDQLVSWGWNQSDTPLDKLNMEDGVCDLRRLEELGMSLLQHQAQANIDLSEAVFGLEAKRVQTNLFKQIARIKNDQQLGNYLRVNIYKLTTLCDSLYLGAGSLEADALLVLGVINELAAPLFHQIPDDVIFPLLFRKAKGEKKILRWNAIQELLVKSGIDPVLIKIMALPFIHFINAAARPDWAEYRYLVNYTTAIEKQALEHSVTSDDWMRLLVLLGFNHSRFTAWCFSLLQQRISCMEKDEATSVLTNSKKDFSIIGAQSTVSFESRKQPIADEINQWIEEELANLYDSDKSGAAALTSRLDELKAAYWLKPPSVGKETKLTGNESLKFIEAKLVILLEHVRNSMNS